MSGAQLGVYFDSRTGRWLYRPPTPFDADDCEAVAGMLGNDGWAVELLAAADEIRRLEAPPVPDAVAGGA